ARQPFELMRGPLLRVTLLRLDEHEHTLLFTMHHIVGDGWSLDVLTNDLAALYEARRQNIVASLPALPVQYSDFALWQREWLQGSVLDEQLAYWRRQLRGLPPVLELPSDWPRPPVRTLSAARKAIVIDEELTRELRALSRREGVTLFMTLL